MTLKDVSLIGEACPPAMVADDGDPVLMFPGTGEAWT